MCIAAHSIYLVGEGVVDGVESSMWGVPKDFPRIQTSSSIIQNNSTLISSMLSGNKITPVIHHPLISWTRIRSGSFGMIQ